LDGKLVSAPALQPRPLRLLPGVDLRRALEHAMVDAGSSAGFVLQGIGSLIDPALRLADAASAAPMAGPYEILTLAGSVAPDGSHLHCSLAGPDGRVIGGHLPYGCRVHTTAEVLLVLLSGWVFDRQPDATTGFLELVVKPG
jgi:predicted DNA-binding protein with PD1-like motif